MAFEGLVVGDRRFRYARRHEGRHESSLRQQMMAEAEHIHPLLSLFVRIHLTASLRDEFGAGHILAAFGGSDKIGDRRATDVGECFAGQEPLM